MVSGDAPEIVLAGRAIGAGHPCYVIAEISANHGGSLGRAQQLVRRAAEAGADAVKLQTYTPDTMTIDSDAPPFVVGAGTPWAGRSLYGLYGEAATPWDWHEPLQRVAAEGGIDLFSSPFDRSAVDFLDDLDVPAFKIASFELVDHELIRYAAGKGRPLVMSTGMASAAEIDEAVAAAVGAGAPGVALLRCNSTYPAAPGEMDLLTIPDMAARWRVPIGFSDHTHTATSAVVAVVLGACIVEKHLTLSRDDAGPDSTFSLEPAEFGDLVAAIREAEAALGRVRYGPSPQEEKSLAFRRSLFVVADVRAGDHFSTANVRSIRPGQGLAPKHLGQVVGRRATRDAPRGTPMAWDLVGPADGRQS